MLTMGFYELTAVLVCAVVLTSAQDANEAAVVRGNNAFGNNWFKIEGHGNAMMSPYSAESALTMLMMGAQGTTLTAMARALGLSEDKDVVARGFQSLIQTQRKIGNKNLTLNAANRIYIDKDFIIKRDYMNTLNNFFLSDIITTDFESHPDESRISINKWVEDETNGKIKDLLPKGMVDSGTRTVLVNAIYFKGNWKYQFDKKDTISSPFHTSCSSFKQVDMMTLTADFNYDETGENQIVQLPYQGEELYMLIILPKFCNGIEELVQGTVNVNITEIQGRMAPMTVVITMPKFKIEQTILMNEDLQKLGMGEIFTDSPDFSGLSDEPIKVSAVIQKTYIEVSEEGTEAAAATAVVGEEPDSADNPEPVVIDFRADHPFTFAIVSRQSRVVLFQGIYEGTD